MNHASYPQLNSDHPKDAVSTGDYSGWLKKLGGKFKTWRKRYFVLHGDKLSYYTGPDELRLLGEFSLKCTEVEALSGESDSNGDNKGYLFVVKPEDPTALLTPSHQQFLLSASSPEERKSWMRAIRKVLYLKDGGALFGTHLSEAFPFTKPEHGYHPRVVHDTTRFIRNYGLETEGVFRKCGTQHALQDLAEAYDVAAPDPILIPKEHNVHLVAGLLKYYLRELPEPVIPFRFYDRLKATGFLIADGQDLTPVIDTLESLPAPNYHLLQYLCHFLYEVAQHESTNRMSIENLASVFAPNILRQADADLDVEMSASSMLNQTIAEFIRANDRLFRLELVPLRQLQSSPRAFYPPSPRRQRRKHVTADSIGLNTARPGDRLAVYYPDVIDPAFKVDKEFTAGYRDSKKRDSPQSYQSRETSFGSAYDNHPSKWDTQNVRHSPLELPTVSVSSVQNSAAPPAPVTSLHLSTPRSERSCLRRQSTHPIVASEYECEDGYSTPTTTTLSSSEVINSASGCSASSLKLLNREKHLQSSGFISCFDCPTNLSFSVGTRSPQSSTKLEHRAKAPNISSPMIHERMYRTSSCNSKYLTAPRRHTSLANGEQVGRYAEETEMPPKPPPFTIASVDGLAGANGPVYSPQAVRSAAQRQPATGTASDSPWLCSSVTHEFDTPNRLRPDDQIRYWRALAVSSRADAAGQRARAHTLTGELNRMRCDLNMAELEIGLLRQRLAAAESQLQHHYQLGLMPAPNQPMWMDGWNTR